MKRPVQWSTLFAMAALVCCADMGRFVWVQDYQAAPPPKGYVIGAGDVIQVRMFGQDQFNTRAKVRADGRISLPLLNDVVAAGYTPGALSQQLETRYKDFVKVPAVTISVEEVRPLAIPVAGEVGKPGVINVERGATLLQVVLLAGGLNDFAHHDRVFVVRPGPTPTRIRFDWDSMLREGPGARFELYADDTVVVE